MTIPTHTPKTNALDEAFKGAEAHRKAILKSPAMKDYFDQLAGGQSPELFVIGCSDSRYSATDVFDQKSGKIFEMQGLGALMPDVPKLPVKVGDWMDSEWACVAYAVKELKVKYLIILGHTGCGAVGGIMTPDAIAHDPEVAAHLHKHRVLRERVNERFGTLKGDAKGLAAVGESVITTYEKVLQFEPVKKAVDQGNLEVHALVYEIANHGAISAWQPMNGEFVLKNALDKDDVSILPRRGPSQPIA